MINYFRGSIVLLFCIFLTFPLKAADDFYAYYTKVQHSATDYFSKYSDIIVVLGEGKQLEFTRKTGYLPLWKTTNGTYLVDDFFPGRDPDYNFYYNYVRLIESSAEKIIVHWRYIPDIETLNEANINLDPLTQHGLTGVVHEQFTIYPNGDVEREIKEAKDTRYEDWIHPDNITRQTLKLLDDGINHSPVHWGSPGPFYPRPAVSGNPVKVMEREIQPVFNLSFNEGLEEHEDNVYDDTEGLESEIEGLMTVYKKGVSGTSLAFDGYYSGIRFNEDLPVFEDEFTINSWIALDVYPYNIAPIIHQSEGFGSAGFYLGVDPYGKAFFTLNGNTVTSTEKLPLYTWTRVAVSVGSGKIELFVNDKIAASGLYSGNFEIPDVPLVIGINTEEERCTDFVRTNEQNLLFIYGIQGLLDEITIFDRKLAKDEINQMFKTFNPSDKKSDLAKGVLPGETGVPEKFGAYYKSLNFHELWDKMFRMTDNADIVVKFEDKPTSVIFWHGTNYAANWITEENQWMSDQSSEIFTRHGCSEHMADKQVRHSYARIIENTPARVVIHWRYPCVDVSYYCANRMNWSDEFHTIYPDGTGIRKVVWNKGSNSPGFQDIQFFTNPGQTALDVVDLQAMTVANLNGEIQKLKWATPNIIPEITIDNATIELLNSKSKYKIFTLFLGGLITPWGENEQSAYTEDPFAGPWNHWPVHLVPSDGRFAVDKDRVTHFALGANDYAPQFGSLVHYGFTDQSIESVIPFAKYWNNPPQIIDFEGGEAMGFNRDQKAYEFLLESEGLSFVIDATKDNPLVNPAIVIQDWAVDNSAVIKINGKELKYGPDCREGNVRDSNGEIVKVIWLNLKSEKPVSVEIERPI